MSWQEQLGFLSQKVLCSEPLGRWTTLGIGGPADFLVRVSSIEELQRLAALIHDEPCLVLGRGSNVVVSDAGFRGFVVLLQGAFDELHIQNRTIEAGAGVALPKLSKAAARAGIRGLEFAMGIPGSVGGGLVMNAGAWGQQMSNTLRSVEVLTHADEMLVLSAKEANFEYRRSALGNFFAVTRAWFEGTPDQPERIMAKTQELYRRKVDSQPFVEQTAGCMFKNPVGASAGKLIDECGLKGTRVGELEVSGKHANFIINHGKGTAADLLRLVEHIQRVVQENTGHRLELEVKLIGFSAP